MLLNVLHLTETQIISQHDPQAVQEEFSVVTSSKYSFNEADEIVKCRHRYKINKPVHLDAAETLVETLTMEQPRQFHVATGNVHKVVGMTFAAPEAIQRQKRD